MSKHKLNPVSRYNEIGIVEYVCYFEIGGDSTVTSGSVRGQHFSVAYSGSGGVYDVTLSDTFRKYLHFEGNVIGSADTFLKLVDEPTVGSETTTFQVVTYSGASATALTTKKLSFRLLVKATIAGEAL